MPEDKNTVDIDTSGPGAEVQVPEDKTFENEVKKPEVKEIKETVSETKAETKSSLTFGE